MGKLLKFKKKEENVISLCSYRKKKKKNGMSEKEFNKKYMKNSLKNVYGDHILDFFNKKDI